MGTIELKSSPFFIQAKPRVLYTPPNIPKSGQIRIRRKIEVESSKNIMLRSFSAMDIPKLNEFSFFEVDEHCGGDEIFDSQGRSFSEHYTADRGLASSYSRSLSMPSLFKRKDVQVEQVSQCPVVPHQARYNAHVAIDMPQTQRVAWRLRKKSIADQILQCVQSLSHCGGTEADLDSNGADTDNEGTTDTPPIQGGGGGTTDIPPIQGGGGNRWTSSSTITTIFMTFPTMLILYVISKDGRALSKDTRYGWTPYAVMGLGNAALIFMMLGLCSSSSSGVFKCLKWIGILLFFCALYVMQLPVLVT